MNRIDVDSLDLNLLKVFEALYEEGGAGRAAIRLGLTQSAVSAALARLRIVYGDHLFERTGRGLRPTRKTEELRPIIASALEKCRQSLQLADPMEGRFYGRTLTLGLSDDYEIAMGRPIIDLVKHRAEGLRLIFRQTNSSLSTEALMSRGIDLALTSGSVASRTVGRKVLGTGGYACVMSQESSTVPTALSLDDYLQRGHILVSSGGFVGVVDEALAAISKTRRVEASTTHFAALPYLLAGSDCVATLPTHAALALARVSSLVCCECPVRLPAYYAELAWRLDSARDPATSLLKDLVAQAAGDFLSHD